jgi:hypothetical protein
MWIMPTFDRPLPARAGARRPGGQPWRQGSILPVLALSLLVVLYASIEASACREALLRRDREEELAYRLVRLQRAVDEAAGRLGRAPRDLVEVAGMMPPAIARIPLDPLTGRARWRYDRESGGGRQVGTEANGEAMDGSQYRDWRSVRHGGAWRVERRASGASGASGASRASGAIRATGATR